MPQPESKDGATAQEQYVRSAAQMMEIGLDPEWVPAIVRNLEMLLNAARVTRVAGADQVDVGQRFEP